MIAPSFDDIHVALWPEGTITIITLTSDVLWYTSCTGVVWPPETLIFVCTLFQLFSGAKSAVNVCPYNACKLPFLRYFFCILSYSSDKALWFMTYWKRKKEWFLKGNEEVNVEVTNKVTLWWRTYTSEAILGCLVCATEQQWVSEWVSE